MSASDDESERINADKCEKARNALRLAGPFPDGFPAHLIAKHYKSKFIPLNSWDREEYIDNSAGSIVLLLIQMQRGWRYNLWDVPDEKRNEILSQQPEYTNLVFSIVEWWVNYADDQEMSLVQSKGCMIMQLLISTIHWSLFDFLVSEIRPTAKQWGDVHQTILDTKSAIDEGWKTVSEQDMKHFDKLYRYSHLVIGKDIAESLNVLGQFDISTVVLDMMYGVTIRSQDFMDAKLC